MAERFSPQEVARQKAPEVEKKAKKAGKAKKNAKYITKVVDGVKHMVLNPNYTFKHTD